MENFYKTECARLQEEIKFLSSNLKELNQIGVSLSSEHDHDKLLEMILQKSMEITSSDAGSLYLVEESEGGGKVLRFKLAQNDSIQTEAFMEFTVPIDRKSLAGFVAKTGEVLNLVDAYQLPKGSEYSFNRNFDERFGYRTKSLLVLPMKNRFSEIIGVLQLINRKKSKPTKLAPDSVEENVVPFDQKSIELVSSIASQAAVSIENNLLYKSIERLFEGFVTASVTAIEQRDPTTSGHSARVSIMTVGLAELVDKADSGRFRDIKFTREQIKEIRYAAVLHDFGKVGVRENVLVKAKKLHPLEMELVKSRFCFIKKGIENEFLRKKIEYLELHRGEICKEVLEQIDFELTENLKEAEMYLQSIRHANEPTIMSEGKFDEILEIAKRTYRNVEGAESPYLLSNEVRNLLTKKGSLNEQERFEIESHVTHTFNFLKKIPWTKNLRKVPSIAYAHHEKVNGEGYPLRLTSPNIPIQSKMMTVSDIFDALTACDRPYKKAAGFERALDILTLEVKDKHLDSDLVDIFIEGKIYNLALEYKG